MPGNILDFLTGQSFKLCQCCLLYTSSLAILVWSVLHSVALQTWLFLNCFVFPLMLLNGLGCLLFFDDRNVTSFHLPISLFEIFRSLTSSILILESIFNVQFSRYHVTCKASYCEESLRDSRRFHRNALLSSFESKQFYLDSVETERFELSTPCLQGLSLIHI